MIPLILSGLRSSHPSLIPRRTCHDPPIDGRTQSHPPHDSPPTAPKTTYEPPRTTSSTTTHHQLKLPETTSKRRLIYADLAHELITLNPSHKLTQQEVDDVIDNAMLEKYRLQDRDPENLPKYVQGVRGRLAQEAAVFWRGNHESDEI